MFGRSRDRHNQRGSLVGRRGVAAAIDFGLLAIYTTSVASVFVRMGMSDRDERWVRRLLGDSRVAIWFERFSVGLPSLAYFAVLEGSPWEGSVGKRLMGIAVRDNLGHRLKASQAWLRIAIKLAPFEIEHALEWQWDEAPESWRDHVVLWSIAGLSAVSFYELVASSGETMLHDRLIGSHIERRGS